MSRLLSKTVLAAAIGALFAAQGYGLISMKDSTNARIAELESQIESMRAQSAARVEQINADIGRVADKVGVTTQEFLEARRLAEQHQSEQARTAERLRHQIAAKADSRSVSEFRQQATAKLQEVHQDATTKFGVVSGEVQTVRLDLENTRNDLASSRRDINDVRSEIARNSGELAELRRRGERDYFEFDIRKGKEFDRVADVQVQLKKSDVKGQKYDVVLLVDDAKVERKQRLVNEPIQFLVGRERLRYEFVVNYVDKDRIRGYLSAPKDKALSAEGPSFRKQ